MVYFAFDPQQKRFRNFPRLQQHPLQLVPPELTLSSKISGRHKNRGGNIVALQRRFGVIEIIRVTVVERDGNSPTRKISPPKPLSQFLQRHGVSASAQELK